MSEKKVRDYDKFMLRFPEGMRNVISKRAKRNGRSMNSEIIHMLENIIDIERKTIYQDDGAPVVYPSKEELEFDTLSEEEKIAIVEKEDPLEAALMKIQYKYNKKMSAEIRKAFQTFCHSDE